MVLEFLSPASDFTIDFAKNIRENVNTTHMNKNLNTILENILPQYVCTVRESSNR